jgi:predicted ATPase
VATDDIEIAGWLVGRDAELDRLVRLVTERRLITLTGPGGAGKTRLARAVAARTADGTRYVCLLAEVEDPGAVRHAMAARLGTLRTDEPLGSSLPIPSDGSRVLVVVDNCEHVLDAAAAVVAELLAAGPHVGVLATSREALRLDGEKVVEVRPLAVPVADDPHRDQFAAVRLFAERARAVRDDFRLDEATLPAVVRICQALDGLPLALEIAAARVRSMGVSDIA